MEPNERQFAAICYLVLMNHHGAGIAEAHPSYAEEKLRLLDMGYRAIAMLDMPNQAAVAAHLAKWGFKMPEELDDQLSGKQMEV